MRHVKCWALSGETRVAERRGIPGTTSAPQRGARKVLVVCSGGLGDAIHLLPALRLVRQNYPEAALHVLMGHQLFFEKLTPWIDFAWPALHRRVVRNRKLVRRLRAERFDAVYSLSWRGSAVFAAWLTGAPLRIGRRGPPDDRWWWQQLALTGVVDYPLRTQPMYYQRWMCLRKAGLVGSDPEFDFQLLPEWFAECGLSEHDRKSYIHVAPFSAEARRDLPLDQCVDLLERVHQAHGRMVLSCDHSADAIARLEKILSMLTFVPWKTYKGTLEIHHFVALIEGARLHLGGDTGGLHVARLVGSPSVSWFRTAFGNAHWAPAVEEYLHRAIISSDSREDSLHGIRTDDLLGLARQLLHGTAGGDCTNICVS